MTNLRIGARRSPLARAQAQWVATRLAEFGVPCTFVGIDTHGDTDRRHLTEIGGTGVFATAVRDQLRAGQVDLAVHSLKDLPTTAAAGLVVAATPIREDVRDVLVGRPITDLDAGILIGTGSPRRLVQLAHRWPKCEFRPIRGNVDTRLELVNSGNVDAIVLAAAGLRRLGHWTGEGDVRELPVTAFPLEHLLPAAGQGALGIEIRADDTDTAKIVALLDDPDTHRAADCERAFLNELESGCLSPVGVVASVEKRDYDAQVLTAVARIGQNCSSKLVSGKPRLVEVSGSATAEAPEELGRRLAREALELLRYRDRM